jgi:hypothetical protein
MRLNSGLSLCIAALLPRWAGAVSSTDQYQDAVCVTQSTSKIYRDRKLTVNRILHNLDTYLIIMLIPPNSANMYILGRVPLMLKNTSVPNQLPTRHKDMLMNSSSLYRNRILFVS